MNFSTLLHSQVKPGETNSQPSLRSIGEHFAYALGLAHAAAVVPEARTLIERIAEAEQQRMTASKLPTLPQPEGNLDERQLSELAIDAQRNATAAAAAGPDEAGRKQVRVRPFGGGRMWYPGAPAHVRRRRRL